MNIHDIAEYLHRHDYRCVSFLRHAAVAAARSLCLYSRGKWYTDKEVIAIECEVARLFPPRGTI